MSICRAPSTAPPIGSPRVRTSLPLCPSPRSSSRGGIARREAAPLESSAAARHRRERIEGVGPGCPQEATARAGLCNQEANRSTMRGASGVLPSVLTAQNAANGLNKPFLLLSRDMAGRCANSPGRGPLVRPASSPIPRVWTTTRDGAHRGSLLSERCQSAIAPRES